VLIFWAKTDFTGTCCSKSPVHRLVWRVSGRAPPQLQRVLALSPPRVGRLPSALLRTTCALSSRIRCSQSLPPSSPPWRAKRRVAASNALACRQLPHCRNRRNGSAQKSPVCWRAQQTSLLGNSCSFDCGRLPVGTHRLSRAPGPPGDQTDDRLGSVWKRGLTPRRKGPPCAADSLPLVTRLLMLLGSRHTTRPAHAGVGGHHTTVSPLFFIAYPQTRVPAPSMLGPYADAAGAGQPMLSDCSNPAS
jgi:hypothetical protein